MRRILLLANHFITLDRFRRELIERLLKEGYEVELALPPGDENEAFEEMGCRVHATPMQRHGLNPARDAALCMRYIRLFRRLKPVVALTYTIKPNIYGSIAARVTGGKIICNITGTGAAFLKENWLSRVARCLYRHSVRHAETVFFQNEDNRRYFRAHGLVRDNDELLPCGSGVNLARFQPSPMPDDAQTHFLFAGRVLRIKGIDAYLACAQRLKAQGVPAVCHVAGFVDEKGYGEKLAALHGAGVIDYLGYCSSMREPLRQCHCVVLPTLGGEGMPNVLLEASASGRACISTRVPGAAEAVKDGETGYLCPPNDVEALYACMLRFIKLPLAQKQRMGEAGRRYMEERFDREYVVERYMQEIEKTGRK